MLVWCKSKRLHSWLGISYSTHCLSIILLHWAVTEIWVCLKLIRLLTWRFGKSMHILIICGPLLNLIFRFTFDCYSLWSYCIASKLCNFFIIKHINWLLPQITYNRLLIFNITINLYFWIMHHLRNERSNSSSIVTTQFIVFFYKSKKLYQIKLTNNKWMNEYTNMFSTRIKLTFNLLYSFGFFLFRSNFLITLSQASFVFMDVIHFIY